jgi:hypothetical protein
MSKSDLEKINKLDKAIMQGLQDLGQTLISQNYHQNTFRLSPTPQTVMRINQIAELCESMVLGVPVFAFSRKYPWLYFPRKKMRSVARDIRTMAMEIAKDVQSLKDVFSIIKMANGGHRFYDPYGDMLTDIYSHEWPNDRIHPKAEIVGSRYVKTHAEAEQSKQDIEAWLTRAKAKCPDVVRGRLGAKRV